MSTSSLSPEELRAAAEVHSELGPAYRDAVVESFLDKVGREIDARVDARLARTQPVAPRLAARDHSFALAIMSLIVGIPITAIVVAAGHNTSGAAEFGGLLLAWAAIAVINVAYALHHRPRPGGR
ncbi:MAG TPA: hypothetical protein VMV07_03900 [Streptosporangiaceae bacterium]|nr:hypothetical protein [Streptosporangiaceae bacterium]